MLMHGFVAFPDYQSGMLPRWLSPVQFGWLGVDLFFVLSGFLITGILLDSRARPHYWRNFYGRRVVRIMPLYFAFVAVAALFYRDHGSYFALATAFLANFASAFQISEPHGPGVLWSLAIEEQFYLVWPLIVLLAGPRRLIWIAAAVVCTTPALRWVWRADGGGTHEMYYFSWFRFDGLALGALVASWVRLPEANYRRSLTFAACLAALSVLITVAALPYGIFTTNSVASGTFRFTQAQLMFAAGLLLAFTLRGTVLTVPLRNRFTKLSAELSFCLYLVHVCILDGWWWVEGAFDLRPAGLSYAAWASVRTTVVIAASFGVALLSQRYLEEPFLKLKRYFV